jgi:hypothetical protein
MNSVIPLQKRFPPQTPKEAVEVLIACDNVLKKVVASSKIIQFSGLVRLRDERRQAMKVLSSRGYK